MTPHEYLISFAFIIFFTFALIVILRQQKTIDRLTDKLMARSYVEYKSMEGVKEEDASPPQKDDEPKSWYDH